LQFKLSIKLENISEKDTKELQNIEM